MADRILSAKYALLYLGGLFVLFFGVDFYQKSQWRWVYQEAEYGPSDVVGIRIGRMDSQIGIIRNNTFEMIVDRQNRSLIPSYVAFPNQEAPLVGFTAKEHMASNPEGVIYDVSFLIGRNFSDPELRDDLKNLPYEVIAKDGLPFIKVRTNGTVILYSSEDITAIVISNLKMMAETYLNRTIQHAVITVPSYFSSAQKQATNDSAAIAGLHVLQMYDEAVVAGIAFEVDIARPGKGLEKCEACTFVVYHIGEKESELVLTSIEDGVFSKLAMTRNKNVGGDKFNQYLLSHTLSLELSKGSILEHYLSDDRSQLEKINDEIFREVCYSLIPKLFKEFNRAWGDVNWIIVTGNPEQSAKLKPLIEACYSQNFDSFNGNFYPNTPLAKSLWQGPIIPENEAIVRGAAIQGSKLSRDANYSNYPIAMESLSLGIETTGDIFTRLIPNNTEIPCRRSQTSTTVSDNQTQIIINILEGERKFASENRYIATLELSGLPPKPKKIPRINVTFTLHPNETLQITAEERFSRVEATIFVEGSRMERYKWMEVDDMVSQSSEDYDVGVKQNGPNKVASEKELSFGIIAIEALDDSENIS